MYKISNYLVIIDGATAGKHGCHFAMSTRYGSVTKIFSQHFFLISEGKFDLIPEKTLTDLLATGVLINENCNELEEILAENAIENDSTRELYIPILPSKACQLNCTYCGQTHSKASPDSTLADGLIDYIFQQIEKYDYPVLRLGIFGAEPMLGYQWLLNFASKLSIVRSRWPSLKISSKIISNGISATKDKVAILVDALGVDSIEITIDGPRDIHNIQRNSKNGRDYFDRIIKNIHLLGTIEGLTVILRCNVTSLSYRHIPDFISYLTRERFNSFALMYFAPVHSWGNAADTMALESKEYSYRELMWKIQLINEGWNIGIIPKRKKITCLATRKNGIIVDPDGYIFDCSEMPLVNTYKGRSIGHISSVVGVIDRPRTFANFAGQVKKNELPCASCFALPVCGGACPKEWAEGREPCPSFKNNAEYVLRTWVNL